MQAREESIIFSELSELCKSPGYVHVIAYLCYRENMVLYDDKMTAKDMAHLFSMTRIIRPEISTLLGLLIQVDIDYSLPSPVIFQEYINRTETLLEEMHKAIAGAFFGGLDPKEAIETGFNPFTFGDALREPIFYSGESAYSFQYREFSTTKYAGDNEWLIANKDFSIQEAKDVVHAILDLQNQKIMSTLKGMSKIAPEEWTILPGFTFSVQEIADFSGISKSSIAAVVKAFTGSVGEKNQCFRSLNDFNVANAMPVLQIDEVNFALLQGYSLVEALYESPFYWLSADKTYVNTAMRNRGRFTEDFCRDRLELVFGKERVFTNVDIFESNDIIGEIDVLVIFGNRIIVVQAKSKRLTLEARKGNDRQIKDDFKKSVQDSYEQGLTCSKSLDVAKYKLVDGNSREIKIPKGLKEIYILCVVSDHYPALSFQSRQFLKYETTESIQPPLILDIFALDAMTEMLPSPLHFLSYVNQRVNYTDKLVVSHELTILSYHLKNNLWLNNEHDMVMLGDDISADLDVAMAVRRDGVNGKSTPDGILTRFKSTTLGRIVKEIESKPDPGTIDLGFLLLTLSEETVLEVSRGIDKLEQLSLHDHKHHDLTIGLDSASTGLTIHINEEPLSAAGPHLQRHCERRKYSQKATSWFGICISPTNKTIRFGLCLKYEWQQNIQMDFMTRDMPRYGNFLESICRKNKVGRNDPCPCGSGKKFKKCCLGK